MPANGTPVARASIWKVLGASTLGTVIELYDFYIYATAAALVFNKLFFPTLDPVAGILAAYAAYAVGFLARPLGGLVFGYCGDRFGRKPVLVITLLLMGLSTAAIGILPTYTEIGIAAPVILTVLRVCQGLGAGAEFAGAILVSAEQSPRHRGFRAAWPAAANDGALILAAGIFAVFSMMPGDQFMTWGWRVPFLLSLVAVALGYFVRRRIPETPEFQAARARTKQTRMPVLEVILTEPRRLLAALGNNVVLSVGYVYQVWALTYMVNTLGISQGVALASLMIAAGCGAVACLVFGALSDRVGRTRAMMFGTLFIAAYAFPFFWLLQTREPLVVVLAMVFGIIGMRSVASIQPSYYADLFPVRLRYSGIAIARELTSAFVAGPLPLVATALVAMSGGDYWPVALVMIVLAFVTAWSIAWSPPPASEPEAESEPNGLVPTVFVVPRERASSDCLRKSDQVSHVPQQDGGKLIISPLLRTVTARSSPAFRRAADISEPGRGLHPQDRNPPLNRP